MRRSLIDQSDVVAFVGDSQSIVRERGSYAFGQAEEVVPVVDEAIERAVAAMEER